MKLAAFLRLVAGLAIGVALAPAAQSASITTTFASNNLFSGNMFDATTSANALTVTGLDINVVSLSGNGVLEVWTKPGSLGTRTARTPFRTVISHGDGRSDFANLYQHRC